MAKVILLTCYDSYCLGIRLMGKLLEEHGHDVNLFFHKINNEERLNQPVQDPKFSQSLRGSTVFTNHYRKELWSKREKDLLLTKLTELKPDLICFSTRSFLDHVNPELLSDIKKKLPSCIIIAGGYGPTSNPELYVEVCDYVGIGEGEELVCEIAHAIDNNLSFTDAPNLFYKKNGQYIRNPLRSLFDVDKVKLPILGSDKVYYIEDDNLHKSDPAFLDEYYTTIMGRGCVGKCSYCTEIDIQRIYESYTLNPFTRRNRSVSCIMEELEFAMCNGFKWVYFADSFLVGPKDYLLEFFNEYKNRINKPLSVQLHLEQMIKYPEILDAACAAGVKWNVIGIQSGSERISIDIYNRKFRNRDIIRFANMLHDRNIIIQYHLILGNPLEIDEYLSETFNLLKQIPFKPEYDELYCFQLRTAPGTPITKLLEKKNLKRLPTNQWLYQAALCQLRIIMRDDDEFEAIKNIEFYRRSPESLCNLVRDIYNDYISKFNLDKFPKEVRTKLLYSSYLNKC